jgi:hypothetical protein
VCHNDGEDEGNGEECYQGPDVEHLREVDCRYMIGFVTCDGS